MSYFVTGTDTDVGKTIFATYLTICGKAKYWKPIQCGRPFDEKIVADLIGSSFVHPGLYQLKKPLSPHQAFEGETVEWDLSSLVVPQGPLVVEGAGGVYVPITWEFHMMDLMAHLKIPIILVARSSLGTLNHSLLSLEALRGRGLPIRALVMAGSPNPLNRQSLERLGQIPVFEFPWLEDLGELKNLNLHKGYDFFWKNDK